MRTAWIIGVSVAHVVAVGGLMMQGCATKRETLPPPSVKVPLPPRTVPVPPPVPPPAPRIDAPVAPGARAWESDVTTVYVVGKGESLSRIASRFGLSMADIVALNNIADPNKVRSGQRLILPGRIDVEAIPAAPATVPAKPTATAVPAGGSEYVIQRGDSLSVIAKKHGVTTAALREANKLKDDRILAGDKLVVPAAAKPAAPAPAKKVEEKPIQINVPQPPAIDEAPVVGGAGRGPAVVAPPVVEPVVKTVDRRAQQRIHKVTPGQSLLSIASQWNVSISDLREANPWLQKQGGEPKAGDEIVVPMID